MSLSDKQWLFLQMVADLIFFAKGKGWKLTGGHLWRDKFTAAHYQARGIGIKNSKHCKRLAIDLNLFIDDVYQTDSDAYKELGEHWEWLGGTWGGRFKKRDGNHFEL